MFTVDVTDEVSKTLQVYSSVYEFMRHFRNFILLYIINGTLEVLNVEVTY